MASTQHCPKCGEDLALDAFPPSCRGKSGAWCRACHRIQKCGPAVRRDCDFCGTTMVVTARRAAEPRVFCRETCKNKYKCAVAKEARRKAAVARPERFCVHCGVVLPKTMRADARFCSEKCNSAAHHLKRVPERRGVGRRREVERAYVLARDRMRCHLCGGLVKYSDVHLDHVIPLSLGGSHDVGNLRVAHSRCNTQKGARARNEQIMLFG